VDSLDSIFFFGGFGGGWWGRGGGNVGISNTIIVIHILAAHSAAHNSGHTLAATQSISATVISEHN